MAPPAAMIHIYIYMCVYIYIERERQRERDYKLLMNFLTEYISKQMEFGAKYN